MPTYSFRCACGSVKDVFFKSLPSEAKQRSASCDACDGKMERNYENEGFFAVGGTNFAVANAAAVACKTGSNGSPVYRDNNGKLHEIRNSGDIDNWRVDNALGKPRLVPWKNQITGETQMVPQRAVMQADPVTGEPLETSPIINREPTKLIPLDSHGQEYTPPSSSKTGLPMKDGVLKIKPEDMTHSLVDPVTGKRPKLKDLWGNGTGGGSGYSGSGDGSNAKSIQEVRKS